MNNHRFCYLVALYRLSTSVAVKTRLYMLMGERRPSKARSLSALFPTYHVVPLTGVPADPGVPETTVLIYMVDVPEDGDVTTI